MPSRTTEIILTCIEDTLEDLEVPEEIKDKIEFEVATVPVQMPVSNLAGAPMKVSLGYLVGITYPTRAGDHIQILDALEDPHDPAEIRRVVLDLYFQVAERVDQADKLHRATSNGHGTTPGGLIVSP